MLDWSTPSRDGRRADWGSKRWPAAICLVSMLSPLGPLWAQVDRPPPFEEGPAVAHGSEHLAPKPKNGPRPVPGVLLQALDAQQMGHWWPCTEQVPACLKITDAHFYCWGDGGPTADWPECRLWHLCLLVQHTGGR